MNAVTHPISVWCKRGAWFVAAIGLIGVIVEIYLFVRSGGDVPLSALLAQLIPLVVSIVSNFVFYALILYAAGVVIDRFFAYAEGRSTMMDTEEERSDLTRGTVEDSAIRSTTVEDATVEPTKASADEERDVTEDATSESTTASADGGSDVTGESTTPSPKKVSRRR